MKLYATTTSERASKGQGGEYLEIAITGAYQTELITLKIVPDGAHYRLTGWTHDNHYIELKINENLGRVPCQSCKRQFTGNKDKEDTCPNCLKTIMAQTKGEKKKGESCFKCGGNIDTQGICFSCGNR